MEIVILGSGTATPLRDRGSPSLLLLIDGCPILFDIGPGTIRQLTQVGTSHDRIQGIFLTHFHPDHTADLIHFIFATRNPAILEKRKPFTITGPFGVKRFIATLQDAYGDSLRLPQGMMRIEEFGVGAMLTKDYGFCRVLAAPTLHTPDSLAYRVEGPEGKAVVYSGDTGFCHEIVNLARGAELLILEAAFPEGEEVDGHLTPLKAGRIATLAGVRRLVLTHFYPECLMSDIASQCRETYDGELILGEDKLRIPG